MINNKIKIKMVEKQITGRELADKIGVHEQTISKWINGKGTEKIEKFIEMCKILELDPRELLE